MGKLCLHNQNMLVYGLMLCVLLNLSCSKFLDHPKCAEPGVEGRNLCYIGSIQQAINNKACCATPDGINAYCMPATDSEDSFCMKYPVRNGEPCGTTKESNYAGLCDYSSSVCEDGVCVSKEATTTTPTTTTTTVTTTAACAPAGEPCWDATINMPWWCCGGATCQGYGPNSVCG